MSDLPVTVIGGGEVFANRYLPALDQLRSSDDSKLAVVYDLASKATVLERVAVDFRDRIDVHPLPNGNPSFLLDQIRDRPPPGAAIVIATPSNFHVPYALPLLDAGFQVAIEKPYTVSMDHRNLFEARIAKEGDSRLFMLGYYALEKGLPGLVLARGLDVPQAYLDVLDFDCPVEKLREALQSLGDLVSIQGVLFEGVGNAGSLDQRSWVLEPELGGNTLETFYHLVCMAIPFAGEMDVRTSSLGAFDAAAERFKQTHQKEAAETATICELRSRRDCPVVLACAKYVPESMHRRGMKAHYSSGEVLIDFETCSAVVSGSFGRHRVGLRSDCKYATQFQLMRAKFSGGGFESEYPLFRDALDLTLRIRSLGLETDRFSYDDTNLGEMSNWDELTGA